MWIKFDDQFCLNPKTSVMDIYEQSLYIVGIIYSCAKLTDGFIPYGVLPMLSAWAKLPYEASDQANDKQMLNQMSNKCQTNVQALAKQLVEHKFWEVVPNGYQIHDFLDWNLSKEEVLKLKEKRSMAGKIGGSHRNKTKNKKNEASDETDDKANAEASDKQMLNQMSGKCSSKCQAKTNPVPVPVPIYLKDCEIENPISRSDKISLSKNSKKEKMKPDDPNYWKFLKENESIGKIFYQSTKLFPVEKQFGLWVKDCAAFQEAGIDPEIIPKAVSYMNEQKLSIKSPGSILTVARQIMNNNNKPEDTGWKPAPRPTNN